MKNIIGIELSKLEEEMIALGQKKYRATQLYIWLYQKQVKSFDEMSDVSLSFREQLKTLYYIGLPKIHTKQVASDGTIKLLVDMEDGSKVETVLMRYDYGNAICVSSQVGCNMGCSFCASGLLKKQRDLTSSEMIGELMVMNELLKEENSKVSHIVVMGTGEPFDNYDNVMDFVKVCNNPKAFEIGARHITVSTCGIADKIYKYADEGLQINLAISLHAPNDELRSNLMRINKAYPLDKVITAVKYYEKKTDRRVTFEYIMLHDVNDSLDHAKQLVNLLKGITNYVNLIPYNEVSTLPYKRTPREYIRSFADYLKNSGVNVTVRKEFGKDIDAACGQLRAKVKN